MSHERSAAVVYLRIASVNLGADLSLDSRRRVVGHRQRGPRVAGIFDGEGAARAGEGGCRERVARAGE